jgi:hypothetical protein
MSPNTSPEVYGEGEVMLVSERAGQLRAGRAGRFYCVSTVSEVRKQVVGVMI